MAEEEKKYYRCRKCGYPGCKEGREASFPRGSKAGEGINRPLYGTSNGVNVYSVEAEGGCPMCGTYLWKEGEEIGT